ncbi:MAG: tetratricopeptide repeat protein, partial [Rhodobacteraceae bacterium]|nr:tetratricopeptide repeat protein [Paracoccaceae bacterium]
ALALAKKAFELKPRHDETLDILLKLQAGSQDWQGARQTLGAKLKNGALPRDVFKRRDAVLALSAAKATAQNSDGENSEAAAKAMQNAAIEAHRQSPDLVPAAVMAAQSYVKSGNKRHATRALRKAWDSHPHPDLAAAFAAIEPEEEATARIKRFGLLTKGKPDHAETKMLMAELQIVAEDFPAAERALGDLVESDPTARVLTLMAAIERGKGADDSVVRGWLTKALTAPRGPQWICNNCQHIHVNWEPVCTQCQGFDTLAWRAPKSTDVAMPSGTEMLPLITGAPEPIVSDGDDDSASDDAATITIEANN